MSIQERMKDNGVDLHKETDTQQQFLSIDFVTALSLDECIVRLNDCDHTAQHEVVIDDDGGFALHCTFSENGVEVRFWGTLEAHARGTWVWGTIFEDRAEQWNLQSWIPAFVVAALLFLAFEALMRAAFDRMALWIGALLIIGVWAIWRWYRRYRHGLRIVSWVYELLYVPPPPIFSAKTPSKE